jgi:hypothetical protein
MRRIFISHSTDRDDTDGKNFVLDVAGGLEQAGFEVFLDRKSLEGGDDWSFKIANYLGYCQGAVVLLSKRALASPYVQAEASDLFFRWKREGRTPDGSPVFPLVPVFVLEAAKPGTPEGDREQGELAAELGRETGFWRRIGFTALQVWRIARINGVSGLRQLARADSLQRHQVHAALCQAYQAQEKRFVERRLPLRFAPEEVPTLRELYSQAKGRHWNPETGRSRRGCGACVHQGIAYTWSSSRFRVPTWRWRV